MLVRDVVQDRNAYYGYHDLETADPAPDSVSEREARFVLRICGRLGIRMVLTDSQSRRIEAAAAGGGAEISRPALTDESGPDALPTLIYTRRMPPDAAVLARHLRSEGNAALLHGSLPPDSLREMPGGVVFSSPCGVLVVSRANMPLVECEMKLPLDHVGL